jgi:hypothetical protein
MQHDREDLTPSGLVAPQFYVASALRSFYKSKSREYPQQVVAG